MTLAIVLAYALGASAGYIASRDPRLADPWSVVIRTQLLLASIFISLLAAWRLEGLGDLLWPLVVGVVCLIVFAAAWLVTPAGPGRRGRATLRGSTALPNTGYWLLPMATIFGGPAATVIAVFVDRMVTVIFGGATFLLRRSAPHPQRLRTSWVDQAPLIALCAGLALNVLSDAPSWTVGALEWMAPVMAMTGAAVYVGSARHPTQRIPLAGGYGPWIALTSVRLALLLPLVALAPTPAVAVVFLLCAFTIPTFSPPQWSVLYGYVDPVVAVAARWGWVFAPIALALGLVALRG